MENRIVEGDLVNVIFQRADCLFEVEVINVPQATGEMWIFKGIEGIIIYVNPCSSDLSQIIRIGHK